MELSLLDASAGKASELRWWLEREALHRKRQALQIVLGAAAWAGLAPLCCLG
jgi:hypothetical protein